MHEAPTPTLLMTCAEACRALRVSPRWLWQRTAPRGDIPAIRVGRMVRYDPADLLRWAESHKKGGAGQ